MHSFRMVSNALKSKVLAIHKNNDYIEHSLGPHRSEKKIVCVLIGTFSPVLQIHRTFGITINAH